MPRSHPKQRPPILRRPRFAVRSSLRSPRGPKAVGSVASHALPTIRSTARRRSPRRRPPTRAARPVRLARGWGSPRGRGVAPAAKGRVGLRIDLRPELRRGCLAKAQWRFRSVKTVKIQAPCVPRDLRGAQPHVAGRVPREASLAVDDRHRVQTGAERVRVVALGVRTVRARTAGPRLAQPAVRLRLLLLQLAVRRKRPDAVDAARLAPRADRAVEQRRREVRCGPGLPAPEEARAEAPERREPNLGSAALGPYARPPRGLRRSLRGRSGRAPGQSPSRTTAGAPRRARWSGRRGRAARPRPAAATVCGRDSRDARTPSGPRARPRPAPRGGARKTRPGHRRPRRPGRASRGTPAVRSPRRTRTRRSARPTTSSAPAPPPRPRRRGPEGARAPRPRPLRSSVGTAVRPSARQSEAGPTHPQDAGEGRRPGERAAARPRTARASRTSASRRPAQGSGQGEGPPRKPRNFALPPSPPARPPARAATPTHGMCTRSHPRRTALAPRPRRPGARRRGQSPGATPPTPSGTGGRARRRTRRDTRRGSASSRTARPRPGRGRGRPVDVAGVLGRVDARGACGRVRTGREPSERAPLARAPRRAAIRPGTRTRRPLRRLAAPGPHGAHSGPPRPGGHVAARTEPGHPDADAAPEFRISQPRSARPRGRRRARRAGRPRSSKFGS